MAIFQVGPEVLSADVAASLAARFGGLQRCSVHLYQSQFLDDQTQIDTVTLVTGQTG